MQFKCSNCDYAKPVGDDMDGQKVTCPICSFVSYVGHAAVEEHVPSDGPSPPTTRSTETNHPFMYAVENYELKRGPFGVSLSYFCPACTQELTSSLNDAGGADHCPECGIRFVVPGEKECKEERVAAAKLESENRALKEQRTEANRIAMVNRAAKKNMREQHLQLDRDPLKEWLTYVSIAAVLLVFAAGKYIVSALIYDTSYLCIVIFALFCLGLLINLRGVLRLRSEYVCAAVCMNNLKKDGGMKQVTASTPAGIFHQHVIDLFNIAKYDDNFTQDSLITLLYSRMMSQSKIVDILSGVLVSLGLIGTIVGLISMTDGLSITLTTLGDQGKATDLLSGMRTTMAGLGTAFYTTLVGAILGSVVLRILNNVYTSNVDHLVTYVASTAEVTIVPRLKRDARREAEAV